MNFELWLVPIHSCFILRFGLLNMHFSRNIMREISLILYNLFWPSFTQFITVQTWLSFFFIILRLRMSCVKTSCFNELLSIRWFQRHVINIRIHFFIWWWYVWSLQTNLMVLLSTYKRWLKHLSDVLIKAIIN